MHAPKQWINVAAFDELAVARSFQQILKGEGLEARIHNERLIQRFWFLAPPRAAFQVQVPKAEFERAENLLNKEPESGILKKAITCPACDSFRIEYPQMTRKFFLPTLALHVGTLLRVIEPECYCESCHHTWKRRRKSEAVPMTGEKTVVTKFP
jgi:hypothetical protein